MYRLLFILSILFVSSLLYGQHENKLIRRGNNQYEEGNYKDAGVLYLKSMDTKDPTFKGAFNLGDAWYKQEIYDQAAIAFDSLKDLDLDKETRAQTYYNLGNSLLKLSQDTTQQVQQSLPASIEAFKSSLRLDPSDEEAKYNLAYAQNLLHEQQQQQQNQDQDQNQDQNKDQNKDQKQDQEQEQEQNEQEKQDQQEQQQKDQQQQPQPQEISKEDAERILEALKNDEKETMENLKKAKVKAVSTRKSEIDW